MENPLRDSRQTDLQELSIESRDQLRTWIRLLQQALAIEADKGFINILGREEHFHSFITRQLNNVPVKSLSDERFARLRDLAKAFVSYPIISEYERRRLIVSSRQTLHRLSKEITVSSDNKKTTLRFSGPLSNRSSARSSFDHSLNLESPIASIKGIGLKMSEKLASIGIIFVVDLLNYYPRDYVDYSSLCKINELKEGETATIVASVRRCNAFKSPKNKNLSIIELQLYDNTGKLKVTRFLAGRRFSSYAFIQSQARLYTPGSIVAVSGLVKNGPYGKNFQDPLIEVLETTNSVLKSKSIGRLLPIYQLTEGLTADRFRDLIEKVIPICTGLPESLPDSCLAKRNLVNRSDAMIGIHRPRNKDNLQEARRRLVFDEFLLLQLGLLKRRLEMRSVSAPVLINLNTSQGLSGKFLNLLPFSLTTAQDRVLCQIKSDLAKSQPMSRLVQGDVGSGKTVVAIASLLEAVQAGWQGAFMAPTEVLAEQHYQTLCKWLPQLHVTVELLTGSTPRSRRRQILDDLSNGSLAILVGTHALIEDPVSFFRLGLVVVDEQHRFGVKQRNRLLSKGLQPHLLTMTATPIPRTLALSLHGDLDVSQIDELPPGRTPIKTKIVNNNNRDMVYQLINEKVALGEQAYVILPLIEDSEKLDLRSAVMVHEQLSSEVFTDLSVGLLHGRLSSADKKNVIQGFSSGKYQVLVATTVVEVGVDVPNATVMVIENADRFGLAQLHQLRGRVGRGDKDSYCLLINGNTNFSTNERLEVLVHSNDGFEISEIDLRLRGPGQVLGTRQSGLPDFALASLVDDGSVLEEAREEAQSLLENDPDLSSNIVLKNLLKNHWRRLSENAYLN